MSLSPLRWRVLLAGAAFLSLVAISCESPVAPRGTGERVPVGRVIEDAMSGDTVRRYSFAATPGGEYAVFGEALQGAVQIVVVDSLHPQLVAGSVFADTGSAPLEENTTPAFFAGNGGTYLISIRAVPAGTAARFRFEVFQVNTAPETHAARFAIGDTVTGEAIDPSVDIDAFVARGDSGQEVVFVTQALGSVGSGVLSLAILDSLGANSLVGFTFADAGTPNPETTGRVMFPATRDYQFKLGAVTGTFPRYRGPYRFWSYAIDRAPEHQPAVVTVGSEVRGEAMDRAGDVDEFTFQATAGQELNAFLQSSRPFQLLVASASGPILAGVSSGGPDTVLFRAATGRFQLTQAGTYVVRVTGLDDRNMADTGSYRFLLYPIDRRPESLGAAVSPGDTITGESIDRAGDIDEFTFVGAAGDEFNAFLQVTGSSQSVMQMEVLDSSGIVLKLAQSVGSDTGLLLQQTGRFILSAAGTYRLRVSGAGTTTDRDTGPYRLLLYRVNRRPEILPDSIPFGDSASGEAIDVPGDVDEFRVTVPDSSGANLVAYVEAGAIGGRLDVSLVDSGGHDVAVAQPPTAGAFGHSGALLLPPGTYILRVQGGSVVGGYRVWIYKFRFGPEIASDTIAIGDTISAEALDPPGDVDKFTLFGRRGDHIDVALQGLQASGEGGFLAVFGASDQLPPISLVFSPLLSDSLGTYESKRIDLTATGWYHLAISAASSPTLLSERGPYRVAVTSLGTAPEHAGVAVSPGDSVTNEAIDYLGDWDEFTLTGTPGQMMAILTQKLSGTGYPRLAVLDTTTGDTLGSVVPQLGEKATARFRIPLSGQLEIAVFQPGVFDFVGAYRLVAQPVNPAPESVPAIYVLGDTIRGEAVFPKADVDDFTSTATPGDTLMPSYRLTANPVPSGELITLQVIDPTTGAVLVGAGVSLNGASPDFFSPGRFIVPAGGVYLIRIHGGGTFGDEIGTAPYEFFVRRAP